MASLLVAPSPIWLPPSILAIDYWYWYVLGGIFRTMDIMGCIFPTMSCTFCILGVFSQWRMAFSSSWVDSLRRGGCARCHAKLFFPEYHEMSWRITRNEENLPIMKKIQPWNENTMHNNENTTHDKPNWKKTKWLAGWLPNHISGSPHPFRSTLLILVYHGCFCLWVVLPIVGGIFVIISGFVKTLIICGFLTTRRLRSSFYWKTTNVMTNQRIYLLKTDKKLGPT